MVRSASNGRRWTRTVRATALPAAALGVVLLVSGCGTGQISQTADTQPAAPGANSTDGPGTAGSIQLRNVLLEYPGVDGYRQGAAAPLQLRIFNTGGRPVTLVRVSTDIASGVTMRSTQAGGRPVRVTIPVDGHVTLSPDASTGLQLDGLTRAIRSGESAKITFGFDNGAEYTLDVPVGLPTAPAPRGSAVFDETSGGH